MALSESILKSKRTFIFLASFVSISLFLKAGFLSVSVILFVLYSLFNLRSAIRDQIKIHKILLLPILLYLICVLWILFTNNFEGATTIVGRKIPMLLFPFCFMLINKNLSSKDLQIILGVFLLGCLLCSLICYGYALFNIIQHKSIIDPNSDHTAYYFTYISLAESVDMDPIYLGLYCNFAFVIAIKTPFVKNLLIRNLIVIYLGIFIILLASKIGIITLVLTSFLLLITKTNKGTLSYILLVLLIPAFLLGIYKSPYLKERFTVSTQFNYTDPDGSHWSSTTARMAIWSCAVEAIKRRPVLGYGTAAGQDGLETIYKEKEFALGIFWAYNPHNEFLTTMLDSGVVGLGSLCMMLILSFTSSIKSKDMLAIYFVIIIALCFCVESILLRQKGIIFFSFFYSLLFWYVNHTGETDSEPSPL